MSKLTRKFMQLFGSTAPTGGVGTGQIGTFGSYAAGSSATSTDPAVIQSLSQWLEGWFSAVTGSNAFAMEDMNAYCYVVAYMLCSIFQDGIPEWETNTTYFKGGFVQDNAGAGNIYVSRTDSNQGNAVTNGNYWIPYKGNKSLNPQVSTALAVRASSNYVAGSATSAVNYRSMCFSPELKLFCAVNDGLLAAAHQISTSPNGITWTDRTASTSSVWWGICWSPELSLFVAVAANNGSTSTVMTSPDGTTWTTRTASVAKNWRSVCWAPELGLFVAVGDTGVMSSSNGTAWTTGTESVSDNWFGVTWSSSLGIFAAVGTGGNVMTSPDGATWTTRTAPIFEWESICWSPDLGIFVAGNADFTTASIMHSYDGITWTNSLLAHPVGIQNIAWSPELGLFLATGQDATYGVWTSPDGITWTAHTGSAGSLWYAVAWGGSVGVFAALPSDASTASMVSKYVQKFISP